MPSLCHSEKRSDEAIHLTTRSMPTLYRRGNIVGVLRITQHKIRRG
jgi:hypothetical protein